MNWNKFINKIINKCNSCKVLRPNYGPKMGYENRKQIVKRENTEPEFMHYHYKNSKLIIDNIFFSKKI